MDTQKLIPTQFSRPFEYFGEWLEINSNANVMWCIQSIRRFLSSKRISQAYNGYTADPSDAPAPLESSWKRTIGGPPRLEKAQKTRQYPDGGYQLRGTRYWKVFDIKGNSSFEDWKEVLTSVIKGLQQMDWFSGKIIHVVADREFASTQLDEWLESVYDVGATLWMKANMYLKGVDDGMPEVKIAILLEKMTEDSPQVLYNQNVKHRRRHSDAKQQFCNECPVKMGKRIWRNDGCGNNAR